MGVDANSVELESEDLIQCTPEATIFSIVELYNALRIRGLSDMAIFYSIEDYRALFMKRGQLPEPVNLRNYVRYRVSLESDSGVVISDQSLEHSLTKAQEFFGKVWLSTKHLFWTTACCWTLMLAFNSENAKMKNAPKKEYIPNAVYEVTTQRRSSVGERRVVGEPRLETGDALNRRAREFDPGPLVGRIVLFFGSIVGTIWIGFRFKKGQNIFSDVFRHPNKTGLENFANIEAYLS